MAGKSESQLGKAVALGAVNCILAVPRLLRADLLVAGEQRVQRSDIATIKVDETENLQKLSQSGRKSNERSTSVKDDAGVVKFSAVLAELDGIKVDLPVSLATKGDPDHLAGIVALVNATKSGLGLVALGVGIAQVEGENGLIQEFLVEHVVEGRNDLVDRNRIEAQTQDAIETAKGESKTGLAGGLGEVLLLDLQVSDLHDVLGHETREAARAILNGELGSVGLVSG
jgi:hypothetical protein